MTFEEMQAILAGMLQSQQRLEALQINAAEEQAAFRQSLELVRENQARAAEKR